LFLIIDMQKHTEIKDNCEIWAKVPGYHAKYAKSGSTQNV